MEKRLIHYNDERYRYDIEIPVNEQAEVFSKILKFDPEEIIKTGKVKHSNLGFGSSGSSFSFRFQVSYFEFEGRRTARFIIFINNKKERIVYEIELKIYKSGSNYAWETNGYSQDKLHFLDELLGKYILTLNNPVLFI